MLLYYLEFLGLGTGTCEASASSMLREGDWDHIRDMIRFNNWLLCATIYTYHLLGLFDMIDMIDMNV